MRRLPFRRSIFRPHWDVRGQGAGPRLLSARKERSAAPETVVGVSHVRRAPGDAALTSTRRLRPYVVACVVQRLAVRRFAANIGDEHHPGLVAQLSWSPVVWTPHRVRPGEGNPPALRSASATETQDIDECEHVDAPENGGWPTGRREARYVGGRGPPD